LNPLARVALLLLFVGAPAFADYDPAMEAREKAQRDAEQRAEQQKQQQMQRQKQEAQAKANAAMLEQKRKTVGAAANGKSDAEVERLYDAKIRKDTEAAQQTMATGRAAMSQGQGAAALKSVTGKSMKEIESMSDAELDALAKDLEKKYK